MKHLNYHYYRKINKLIQPVLTIKSKEFPIGHLHYINENETNYTIDEIFNHKYYLSNFISLNPGDVIFDIGANIGIFSLFALNVCEKNAEIYCFEPIPITFECLSKNLAPYPNVHLFMAGISNVNLETETTFTLFGTSTLSATYRPEEKIISNFKPLLDLDNLLTITQNYFKDIYFLLKNVPSSRPAIIQKFYNAATEETKVKCKLISLGHFIEQNQIDHIDLIKIDVECAELDVINSIKPDQFEKIRQFSIEVNDNNHRADIICDILDNHHYQIKAFDNPLFNLPGFNHKMILAKK